MEVRGRWHATSAVDRALAGTAACRLHLRQLCREQRTATAQLHNVTAYAAYDADRCCSAASAVVGRGSVKLCMMVHTCPGCVLSPFGGGTSRDHRNPKRSPYKKRISRKR